MARIFIHQTESCMNGTGSIFKSRGSGRGKWIDTDKLVTAEETDIAIDTWLSGISVTNDEKRWNVLKSEGITRELAAYLDIEGWVAYANIIHGYEAQGCYDAARAYEAWANLPENDFKATDRDEFAAEYVCTEDWDVFVKGYVGSGQAGAIENSLLIYFDYEKYGEDMKSDYYTIDNHIFRVV